MKVFVIRCSSQNAFCFSDEIIQYDTHTACKELKRPVKSLRGEYYADVNSKPTLMLRSAYHQKTLILSEYC